MKWLHETSAKSDGCIQDLWKSFQAFAQRISHLVFILSGSYLYISMILIITKNFANNFILTLRTVKLLKTVLLLYGFSGNTLSWLAQFVSKWNVHTEENSRDKRLLRILDFGASKRGSMLSNRVRSSSMTPYQTCFEWTHFTEWF